MAKAKWLEVSPSQGMENGIVYRCIRDSGIALTHSLDSLVGLYVEKL